MRCGNAPPRDSKCKAYHGSFLYVLDNPAYFDATSGFRKRFQDLAKECCSSSIEEFGPTETRSSRRKVQLVLLLTTALLLAMRTRMPREVWSFPRSSAWWDEVVCKTFTHRDWVENFRVSQETFFYTCTELHSEIERQNTRFRKAVSVQK